MEVRAKIMMVMVIKLAFFSATIMIDSVLAASVPDTGQTKCYSTYLEITCPKPGEPFYGQDAQYITNPQSFTKLDEQGNSMPVEAPSWAMVRDNVTGLIWEVKTDDGGIHDVDNHYDWNWAWSFFIYNLNRENFGGYSDWRLPTVKELSYLADRSRSYPSINTTYFPNSVNNRPDSEKTWQWHTSTDDADDPNLNWRVKFEWGRIRGSYPKSELKLVRAVRGGQSESVDNFIENGDGTVTDTNTGLMWQQDTAPDTNNWQQALAYCENLTLAGYSDWRLPNITELTSLVDYTASNPAVQTSFFPNTESSMYWSSTTWADYLSMAWYTRFDNGCTYFGDKLNDFLFVRAVREGNALVDSDSDGICDDEDNCPNHPNATLLGTCVKTILDSSITHGYRMISTHDYITCTSDADCIEIGGFCQMKQEDWNNNGAGDVCECYTNCNYPPDLKVTGQDLKIYHLEYGRIDCNPSKPCYIDFNGDGKVNGFELTLFKNEYGRDDCPAIP